MLDRYDDIFGVNEVCEILHLGKNSVYTLLQNGTIPSMRIKRKYRISKLAMINYIKSLSEVTKPL